MPDDLTERQRQIYEWISTFIEEHGYAPSMREIGDAHGISSTQGVSDHLDALERKGWIQRQHRQPRTIQLRE